METGSTILHADLDAFSITQLGMVRQASPPLQQENAESLPPRRQMS
jgi:hypothetical protein